MSDGFVKNLGCQKTVKQKFCDDISCIVLHNMQLNAKSVQKFCEATRPVGH